MSVLNSTEKQQINQLLEEAILKINEAQQRIEQLNCAVIPDDDNDNDNDNSNGNNDGDGNNGNGNGNDPGPVIVGVNMGKEYDQLQGAHPIINYGIEHVRLFVLLEDLYKGRFPSVEEPDYNPTNLDDWSYGMMGYRHRLRQLKNQGFDVRLSLESIFEKDQNGNVVRVRKFPNKSYSRSEWGGSEANIKANAKKLAIAIHRMYGEFITRVEVTNEAWGEPGFDAIKWITRGFIDGFQEVNSPIKLSLGAFQAYEPNNRWTCTDCAYPNGDYIGNVFEDWMLPYVDEITVHPYAFKLGTIQLNGRPDSSDNEFKYLHDMIDWRNNNYPNLKLSITETGWNTHEVGEQNQAAYLNQVIEIAGQNNIHAVYIYEAVDSPTDGLFTTCGLFKTNSPARKPEQPKAFLTQRQGMQAASATG